MRYGTYAEVDDIRIHGDCLAKSFDGKTVTPEQRAVICSHSIDRSIDRGDIGDGITHDWLTKIAIGGIVPALRAIESLECKKGVVCCGNGEDVRHGRDIWNNWSLCYHPCGSGLRCPGKRCAGDTGEEDE